MEQLPEATTTHSEFGAIPADFAPLAPLPLGADPTDWEDECAYQVADLAVTNIEALDIIYSRYYEDGFIGFLNRKLHRVVPEGDEDRLAMAIADKLYRHRLSSILSVIQKSAMIWTGVGFLLVIGGNKIQDAFLWASPVVAVAAPVAALVEQPKKRREVYQDARSVF
jgi:hypothetical protein